MKYKNMIIYFLSVYFFNIQAMNHKIEKQKFICNEIFPRDITGKEILPKANIIAAKLLSRFYYSLWWERKLSISSDACDLAPLFAKNLKTCLNKDNLERYFASTNSEILKKIALAIPIKSLIEDAKIYESLNTFVDNLNLGNEDRMKINLKFCKELMEKIFLIEEDHYRWKYVELQYDGRLTEYIRCKIISLVNTEGSILTKSGEKKRKNLSGRFLTYIENEKSTLGLYYSKLACDILVQEPELYDYVCINYQNQGEAFQFEQQTKKIEAERKKWESANGCKL